jgi:hypothetical protein
VRISNLILPVCLLKFVPSFSLCFIINYFFLLVCLSLCVPSPRVYAILLYDF